MNKNQLGEFWQCVVKDRDTFCPEHCEKCHVCKIMHEVFVELQDAYLFSTKTTQANSHEPIPYQPVLWRVFTNVIDKNTKKIYIVIAKSVPNNDLVLVHEYYYNKQKHHKSCVCCSCKILGYLLNEMERWDFYGLNGFHDKWFITFHKSSKKITLFPVFILKNVKTDNSKILFRILPKTR